jgi:hypothetical protein
VRFCYCLSIAGLILLVSSSCKERGGKYIDQGEIHYNIEYVGNTGTISKELKPRNLVVSFKKDKILFEILAPIGNAGIINVSNPEQEIYDSYINFFTIRYYYASKPGEIYPGFEEMQGMEIRKTSKTTLICGYNCKNAEVTFPSDRNKAYNIWYTNEIKVKNPNASTPFREIDGTLMSFFFFLGKSEIHFDAETIFKKDIPDKAFERREKYTRVSKDDLNKFIIKMINI